MVQNKTSARDRIIVAADKLFYGAGIRATSVDTIAEVAGVTKNTFYYHFKSKDDLIDAYLSARDEPNLARYRNWYDEADGDVPEKVAAIFLNIAKRARRPQWKGCGFLRTAAEFVNTPGHPAIQTGSAHKKKFEVWLAERFEEAELDHPVDLSRHIALLIDGAFSTMLIHRDVSYAEHAAEAAKILVASARKI
ncbi:TetR/AcrR family transcriptional regulator [uncultured Tateyamaria sp.]|uniref:TetR/AcrR family transcriptional regulator n=1 Tax=uncultured Tateyamaria sp. TaxID=455651 RepID=UPI00262866C1|nr:TetR/AcrR family transcriptional regulator [uncultured Tateyamaria sp.]